MADSRTIDELLLAEQRVLAVDILQRKLEEHDLPLPKDSSLDIHVAALLRANPQITVTALERVMAQQDAYSEALRAIGMPVPALPQVVDIEL